jgi:predicted HTH transcriptional regulator
MKFIRIVLSYCIFVENNTKNSSYFYKNISKLGEHYIKKLIKEGEHQQLDFKFEISDSRKISRTLVAFANTDGGKLLVGVKDNGAIAGVRTEEEYYMVEAAANIYCKPPVPFEVKKWIVDSKTVLEIDVSKSNKRFFAKSDDGRWLAYVRVLDQNILANKIMLEVWKRKDEARPTFIKYTDNEKMLLEYLSVNDEITLSKFTRISKLTRQQAEKVLINLLCFDVIQMRLTDKGAFYSLIASPTTQSSS